MSRFLGIDTTDSMMSGPEHCRALGAEHVQNRCLGTSNGQGHLIETTMIGVAILQRMSRLAEYIDYQMNRK